MKHIKRYLKAIQIYEEQNNCFDLLNDYLKEKKSTLPKFYCEGKVHLPSFMMLRKIHYKYKKQSCLDSELNRLFESSIHCSKLFYSKLVSLIMNSRASAIDFEKQFTLRIQPLGQQLINLITNIKYRIKLVELESFKSNSTGFTTFTKKISNFGRLVYGSFNNLIYKATLLQSTEPALARKMYYFLIIAIIALFWMMNFMFLNNKIPMVTSTFINIISGIVVIVTAIIISPIGDFGKIDISGKNNVAYIYKLFFNNHDNSKMLQVFIPSFPSTAGQTAITEVDL